MRNARWLSLWIALSAAAAPAAFAAEPASFSKDVFPILEKKCSGCHFPEAESLKGDLDVSTVAAILKGGKAGVSVIPGKGDESPLVQMLEWKLEPHMPPPKQFKRLKQEEIETIKRWINEGANADGAASAAPAAAPAPAPAEAPANTPPAAPAPAPAAEAKPAPAEAPAPVPAAAPAPAPADKPAEKEIAALPRPDAPKPAAEAAAAPAAPTPNPAAVASLAFAPGSPAIFARGGLHTVELLSINPETGAAEPLATLGNHAELVRALAFSPDGKLLAAAGGKPARQGEIVIWDVGSRSMVRAIASHRDNILEIAFSPDGKRLASASYDKTIKLWNAETGEELHTLKDHVDAVYALAFSPDGKLLASGAGDRTVRLWDPETGKLMLTFTESTDSVMTLAFSPDGKSLAGGSADKKIRVWDVEKSFAAFAQTNASAGVLAGSSFAHDGAVLRLVYSPDGATIFSTSEDRRIKAWDAATLAEKFAFEPQSDWVTSLAVSPDGKWLAAGRYDSSITAYAAADGKPVWGPNPGIRDVAAPAAETAKPEEKEEAKAEEPAGRKKITNLGVEAVVIKATIPPSLASIGPDRMHRGTDVEVTLSGKNLEGGVPVIVPDSIQAEILEVKAHPIPEPGKLDGPRGTGADIFDNAQPYDYRLKLKIPAEAPARRYEIFMRTPGGLAGPVGFDVLLAADLGEAEPNDSAETAQAIPATGVVIGNMNKAGDADRFKFAAKENQELVFALTDTGLNASMKIFDAEGKLLASNDEPGAMSERRLGFRFPAAGEYALELSDRDLRGGIGYRLHAGEFPMVTGVFPLGVPAGAPQKVQVTGFNIGAATELEIDPPDAAGIDERMDIPTPDYPGSPVGRRSIAVGKFAEAMETEPNNELANAQTIASPGTINARLLAADGAASDADLYRFTAAAGRTVIIETAAGRLGSPADTLVDILDLEGKLLERGQIRCVSQTFVTLSNREARGMGFRLDAWADFAIGDYAMIGSEILQVMTLPDYGDEDVVFRGHSNGWRKGQFGTTPEFHAVYTPVYKVEVHPAGAALTPNGMPVFPLYWRNDDSVWEGGAGNGDSRIEFEAPKDGEYLIRVREANGKSGERLAYRLTLREPEPDYRITAGPYRINMNAAGRALLDVRAIRQDGFSAPINVKVEGLPEGFAATEGTILEGEDTVRLELAAAPGAKTMALGEGYKIVAAAEVAGAEAKREAGLGPVTIVERQPDLVVQTAERALDLEPGKSVWIQAKLEKHNGFDSRVPLDVENLPFGVRVLDTGLNGILVREGELERPIQVYAEPWVKPMTRKIWVQAQIETLSVRPVFFSEAIELRIGPKPAEVPPAPPAVAWDAPTVRAFLASL